VSLRIDATKGTVKQDLAELPQKMLDAAFEAINDCADLMVDIAKSMVRVDTGTLQKSIRKEVVSAGGGLKRVVRVRAGGYVVNPKTGLLCNYATFIEAKHPFMRPAFENVRPVIEERIRNSVVARVNK